MKYTNKSAIGTSYHDSTVSASYNELIQILGAAKFCENDGRSKVNYDWILEIESGDVFTIYDWKYFRPIKDDEIIIWHIGGHTKAVTESVRLELETTLNNLRTNND